MIERYKQEYDFNNSLDDVSNPATILEYQKKSSRKFPSIKNKVILFALFLGVLPVSIIGFFAYKILERPITVKIEKQQLETTEIAADSVTRFLSDRINEINVLSKNMIFTNSKFRDKTTIQEKTAILNDFKDETKFYNSIIFFDLQGNPLFQAKTDNPYRDNYGSKGYFKEAVKTKKITINGPGISPSSGQLRVEFAAPVKDINTGKLVGILRLKIPGKYINSLFNIYDKQNLSWYLTNAEGTIFAGNINEHLNKSLSNYYPGIERLHQAKQTGIIQTSQNNKDNLVSHISIVPPDGFSNLHIGTSIVQDRNIALASLKKLGWILFMGTSIAAILVSLMAFYLGNRAVIPLLEAVTAVKKIGNGDLDTRLRVRRQDELGELNANINLMTERIQNLLESQIHLTEEQNKEREELEAAIFTLIDEVSDATNGDLTVRANLNSLELSTVADLFNAIINSLEEIAIEAKESTTQVGSSLKQNEAAIRLLAKQAITEARETHNTLISIEEMSESIHSIAENAKEAEKITNRTYNTVLNSSNNMDLTVDSIINLRNTVAETAKKMKRLGESSQKISQAVSFIEEIALKTNVLAINASVEAGRAGEYGQGFTIVAEQVSTLAEQSTAAIKEIAAIVTTIQTETQEVNQAMESGTSQVVETTELVKSTKESLGEVLKRSQEINDLMGSISETTISQALTSQKVTNLMQKIARLSETTSQSSEKVARSIVKTAKVAEKLQSTVAQFKVNS